MSDVRSGAPRPAAPQLAALGEKDAGPSEVVACRACDTQLAPSLLACPGCGALVHARELTALAARADEAERAGDLRQSAQAWRDALELLPPTAPQHAAVLARLDDLARRIDALPVIAAPGASGAPAGGAGGSAGGGGSLKRAWGGVGAILVVLLSKAKLLLLGLTKAGTLLTMLGSVGVYWRLYGWKLAAGLVLSIYLHEMGHLFALTRYGVAAEAPMFVPGVGAYVRSRQQLHAPREIAFVGLAGPLWGLGAALFAYGAFLATGAGVWGAIAGWGAVINLFNLAPVWQLDGARGVRALSRPQRWALACVAAIAGVAFAKVGVLVALVVAWRAFADKDAPARGDQRAFALFAGLVVALALVIWATASVVNAR